MGLLQTAPAPVLVYGSVPAGYRVRTILAPVDFSPFSRTAVEWALCLAALVGARLRLLHVVPDPSSKWARRLRRAAVEMVADERRRAERQLREFGSPGISVEAVVAQSRDPAAGIREAQRDGIDLVALGASGRTGLDSMLGSVTRRVARDCVCPVLVLPVSTRVSPREVWRRGVGAPASSSSESADSASARSSRRRR